MQCPNCGFENWAGARFYGRCGLALPSDPDPSSEQGRGAGPAAYEPIPNEPVSEVPLHDAAPPIRRETRRAWLLGIGAALLTGILVCCGVFMLAVGPAFGRSVPPTAPVDPTSPDLTIRVEEGYISDMLAGTLPEGTVGETVLDVQPNNRLVMTTNFRLLVLRLTIVVHSRIAVEEGQVRVYVEEVETGDQDLFTLIGIDDVTLGATFTQAIQSGLESELGPGSRLLEISTDEEAVILKVSLE